VSGLEFPICKVTKKSGVLTELKDYRKNRFSNLETNELYNIVSQDVNPLIGVESLIWEPRISTQCESIIRIGFGFRPSAYTIDYPGNLITITAGIGGFFKTSNDFVSTNFDGWRIYSQRTGKYHKITTSTKSSSNILCYMDAVDPDYIQSGDTLFVVPDAEEIQIQICDSAGTQLSTLNSSYTIPIKSAFIDIKLPQQRDGLVGNGAKYVFKYRYKSNYNYSERQNVLKNKYTREDGTSFDGTPYSDPIITFLRNPSSLIKNVSGEPKSTTIGNANYYWDTFGDGNKIKLTGLFTLTGSKAIFLPAERGTGGKILEKGMSFEVEWRAIVDPSTSYTISFCTMDYQPIAAGTINPDTAVFLEYVLTLNAAMLRRSNFLIKFTYLGSFLWNNEIIYLGNNGNASSGLLYGESNWQVSGTDFSPTFYTNWGSKSDDNIRVKRTLDDVFLEGTFTCISSFSLPNGSTLLLNALPVYCRPKQETTRNSIIIMEDAGTFTYRPITLIFGTDGKITVSYLYVDGGATGYPSFIHLGGISFKINNSN